MEVTKKFMRNPVRILVKKEQLTLEGIKQFYIGVEKEVSVDREKRGRIILSFRKSSCSSPRHLLASSLPLLILGLAIARSCVN